MKPPRHNGTMAFCSRCPASKNCCTRVAHGSEIEHPFVFEEEIDALSRASGLPSSAFIAKRYTSDGEAYNSLKSHKSGCIFFAGGSCQVYDIRPLDCRLFPFDIRADSKGVLFWIVYTTLCPVNFNIDDNFHSTKAMFGAAGVTLEEAAAYVRSDAQGMASLPFKVIEPLGICISDYKPTLGIERASLASE